MLPNLHLLLLNDRELSTREEFAEDFHRDLGARTTGFPAKTARHTRTVMIRRRRTTHPSSQGITPELR